MADNVAITAGSGTNMATDDIGGVHYPRAKMTWGPDGTANDTDVATGKPLPIQLRSSTGNAVTVTDAAPSASDYGLVVIQHPDGQNANGRASAANSTPVVLSNEDKTALADDAAFTAGTSPVNVAGFVADEASTDSVDEGDAGAARMTLDRKLIVTVQPHTAGGKSVYRNVDLDEADQQIKSGATTLHGGWVTNTATATRWLHFWNDLAANVTVGSTTPRISIGIPGNSSDDISAVLNAGESGVAFETALTVACTTAVDGTGAPSTGDMVVNLFYK